MTRSLYKKNGRIKGVRELMIEEGVKLTFLPRNLLKRLEELEKELVNLVKNEVEEKRKEEQEKLKKIEDYLDSEKVKSENLEKDREELKDKNTKLKKNLSTKDKKIKELNKANEFLKNGSRNLENRNQELDKKLNKLNQENETNKKWKIALKRETKKLVKTEKESIQELAQTRKKINYLVKNLGKLATNYAKEKAQNKKLTTDKKALKHELKVITQKKDKVCQKLKVLKEKQKELKQTAKSNQVSLTLIKYSPPTTAFYKPEKDNSIISEIVATANSLIDMIAKTQRHLKVNDLTQITTSHQMPEGKSLKDLIYFYNNPPLCLNPRHANYEELAAKFNQLLPTVEIHSTSPLANNSPEPLVKEIVQDKIIEVDNPAQAIEIKKLKEVIQQLEKKLQGKKPTIIQDSKTIKDQKITIYFLLGMVIVLVGTITLALVSKKKKKNVNIRFT